MIGNKPKFRLESISHIPAGISNVIKEIIAEITQDTRLKPSFASIRENYSCNPYCSCNTQCRGHDECNYCPCVSNCGCDLDCNTHNDGCVCDNYTDCDCNLDECGCHTR
jgi:hypothetical protein